MNVLKVEHALAFQKEAFEARHRKKSRGTFHELAEVRGVDEQLTGSPEADFLLSSLQKSTGNQQRLHLSHICLSGVPGCSKWHVPSATQRRERQRPSALRVGALPFRCAKGFGFRFLLVPGSYRAQGLGDGAACDGSYKRCVKTTSSLLAAVIRTTGRSWLAGLRILSVFCHETRKERPRRHLFFDKGCWT